VSESPVPTCAGTARSTMMVRNAHDRLESGHGQWSTSPAIGVAMTHVGHLIVVELDRSVRLSVRMRLPEMGGLGQFPRSTMMGDVEGDAAGVIVQGAIRAALSASRFSWEV